MFPRNMDMRGSNRRFEQMPERLKIIGVMLTARPLHLLVIDGTPIVRADKPNYREPEIHHEELKQIRGLVGYSQGSTRDGTDPIRKTRGADRRG